MENVYSLLATKNKKRNFKVFGLDYSFLLIPKLINGTSSDPTNQNNVFEKNRYSATAAVHCAVVSTSVLL